MQSLAEVRNGEICTIKWLMGDSDTVAMMKSYALGEGSRIRMIQQCMGNVIIGFNGIRLAIGNQAAERIKV